MKRLTKVGVIAFIGLSLFFGNSLQAQFTIPDSLIGYRTSVYRLGDSMIVRVLPMNYASLKHSQEYGSYLKRYRSSKLNPGDTVRVDSVFIKGKAEAYWDTAYVRSTKHTIAAASLYGDFVRQDTIPANDYATMFNESGDKENRYSYTLFSAEQDLSVAKDLGLLYVDYDLDSTKNYFYMVEPVKLPGTTRSKYRVYGASKDPVKVDSFAAPVKPVAISGIHKIKILLDQAFSKQKYSSFHVQRSDDGGATFHTITKEPLVQVEDPKSDNKDLLTFIDSLRQVNKVFYYRVGAFSPAGTVTEWSDTVAAWSLPPPLPYLPSIDSIVNTGEGRFKLTWNFPVAGTNKIKGFNIYRNHSRFDAFTKINTQLIPANTRVFNDMNGKASNYYYVEAIDSNDYQLTSVVKFAQGKDDQPPAMPSGLQGKVKKDGTIVIWWNRNTEEDLLGYRVYFAEDNEAKNMVLISPRTVKDTMCNYKIDMNLERKMVHVQVLAEDFRQNYSVRTAVLTLPVPDVWSPADPIIERADAYYTGVKIKYLPSASQDVVQHELQRRVLGTIDWVSLKFPPRNDAGNTPGSQAALDSFTFFDTTANAKIEFEYRVIAKDGAGNTGASKTITSKAIRNGIRNVDLTLTIDKTKIKGGLVVTFPYTQDITEVHSFLVMRSINGAPFVEVKTIFPDDPLVVIPGTYIGDSQFTGSLPMPSGVYGFIDYLGERKDPVRYYSYKVKVRYLDSDESPPSTSATIDLLR